MVATYTEVTSTGQGGRIKYREMAGLYSLFWLERGKPQVRDDLDWQEVLELLDRIQARGVLSWVLNKKAGAAAPALK